MMASGLIHPMSIPTNEITRLLAFAGRGQEEAARDLFAAVYAELRRMAAPPVEIMLPREAGDPSGSRTTQIT